MTSKLSYPSLKCILEFLEVSPRFHMSSRCSDVQIVEKLIPLRAGKLEIWKNKVALDNMTYCTESSESGQNERKRMKIDNREEKLFKKYFEERSNIHVDMVVFHEPPFYRRIPVTLQLVVNKLEIPSSSFEDYLPRIHTNSFPLKNLTLSLDESFDVNHLVIASAQNVILRHVGRDNLHGVEKLRREKLLIENSGFQNVDVVGIIRNWMENRRKIGTEFLISNNLVSMCSTFSRIEREFDNFKKKLEGVNEPILDSQPQFSIPMSSTANILVYGNEKESGPRTVYQIVLRVVAVEE